MCAVRKDFPWENDTFQRPKPPEPQRHAHFNDFGVFIAPKSTPKSIIKSIISIPELMNETSINT